MKQWIVAVSALALLTGCGKGQDAKAPATATPPPPAPVVAKSADTLDCATPIAPDATLATLKAKYGADLKLGDIPGAEGQTTKGAILFSGAPLRTLQVTFWDKAMAHLSSVGPADGATAWKAPGGIHLGSTLAEVEAANGRSFGIGGFGWDYGGYVLDFKGGALDHPGGCNLSIRFDAGNNDKPMPDGISGDGVTVTSDDPRVRSWGPVVSEISVGWPLPPGVTPVE